MPTNANLHKAKEAKNDEFYTQLSDINAELQHYDAKNFENKTVLCNCDDPDWSNFFKYFKDNFKTYHLKKLISTHFNKDGSPSYAVIYDGTNTETVPLKGNGDFASDECVAYLKEADIVVTNPPFSVFRKFVAMLMEYEKKFIIIGNINAIIYKEIFPLIKDNKVWFGYNNGAKTYEVPEDYKGNKFEKDGKWWAKVLTRWYTNIELKKRQGFLKLTEKYDPKYYPKYDNYDAINVDKVADIPCDYDGVIGVPITFLDKYNPDQFELLGYTGGLGWNEQNDVQTTKEYMDAKQHNPDGSITSGGKVNTCATLRYDSIPADRYYSASNVNGYLLCTYCRILIRKKGGTN